MTNWKEDPKVNEAHEDFRASVRDYAIALANDLDSVGKLAVARKRQVNEKLDVLLEAVAASGSPPSPAQVCPICVGRGVVSYPPNTPIDQPSFVSSSTGPWSCPFCKGTMLVGASSGSTGAPPRDWPEDFSHENGRYSCRCTLCGKMFEGHKRRVICKLWAGAGSTGGAPPAKEVWAILYEDADKQVPEVFVGHGAEEAARRTFADRLMNWTCHLLCTAGGAPT